MLEWHHRRFMQQATTLSGSSASNLYPGLQRSEIVTLTGDVRQHGIKGMPRSDAQIKRLLASLLSDGMIVRRGFRYCPAGVGRPETEPQPTLVSDEHLFVEHPDDDGYSSAGN